MGYTRAEGKKLRGTLLEAPIFPVDQFLRYCEPKFISPPDIGVSELIAKIPFRPLGKSAFKLCPWSDDIEDDDYVPTKLNVQALKVGLSKAERPIPLIDESLAKQTDEILLREMKKIWLNTPQQNVLTYEEALTYIKRDKSPGYPYFYRYQNKGDALDTEPQEIKQLVSNLMKGEEVPCVFSLTEKSELRPKEKVAANKTRVFMASPIHHLIACLQLFQIQNDTIMSRIGYHPITIGIQIPGAQFVQFLKSFGDDCNDGDVDGCDLGFHPRVANFIGNLRAHFLPPQYKQTVNWLYNTVYAGYAAGCGGVYRVYGNKSGWCNTSHDNSLMVWWYLIYGATHFYPDLYWGEVVKALINGDDVFLKYKGDFVEFTRYLASYGCRIEAEDWNKRHFTECVFLSHHVETRWVTGFGDFCLAAGNLPKLLSSVNWVKTSKNLSFEESCVAHLVGLRMCLFPWAEQFERVDEILTNYLQQVVVTPFMESCLTARFTEIEMAYLNTRCENQDVGRSIFTYFESCIRLEQVLKGLVRLFKRNHDTNSISKTTR